MSQLVRQQSAAWFGVWPIESSPKDDARADGVGPCTERAGGCCGAGVRVHAHAPEVMAEPWLKEVAR